MGRIRCRIIVDFRKQCEDFLRNSVGDIHEKYLLEEQLEEEDDFDILSEEDLSDEERQFFEELEMMEEDVENDFDEEDIDFEPFTTFTFIRYHKGIRIEELFDPCKRRYIYRAYP